MKKTTNESQISYNYGRVLYPELESILAKLINTNEIEPLEAAVEQFLNAGKDKVVVLDLMSGPERMQTLIERLNRRGTNIKDKIQAIAIGLHTDVRTKEQIETDEKKWCFLSNRRRYDRKNMVRFR